MGIALGIVTRRAETTGSASVASIARPGEGRAGKRPLRNAVVKDFLTTVAKIPPFPAV